MNFNNKCKIYLTSSVCNLSGNKLITDDLGCVLEEVIDVSAQWYHLGLQLKVKTGTLDSISIQFSRPRDQLLEMLKTWLTTGNEPKFSGKKGLPGPIFRKCSSKGEEKEHLAHLPPLQLQRTQLRDTRENPAP